ncbi:hypothetical protein L195_g039149 [Trifolium pratense]|uniref:Uncharacterized protein n=1 Tax=Trifolium pratense TaxID=57577 RepID=A0A2K3LX51_TRIPR|nr:hypothetical protein L195_g039149 [Trifolium pratense]
MALDSFTSGTALEAISQITNTVSEFVFVSDDVLVKKGLSAGITEEIKRLRDNMQAAEFKAAVSEEEILEKIELGIQEKN